MGTGIDKRKSRDSVGEKAIRIHYIPYIKLSNNKTNKNENDIL